MFWPSAFIVFTTITTAVSVRLSSISFTARLIAITIIAIIGRVTKISFMPTVEEVWKIGHHCQWTWTIPPNQLFV